MQQISTLLNTLEVRLYYFQQLLPQLDHRPGLINFSGIILKSLLGTATVEDIHLLHETLDGLRSTTSDIVHSLNIQLTYVKNLGTVTSVNTMANANLSSIVGKYSFVNRTVTDWNQLTVGGIGALTGNSFRKRVRKVITSEAK